MRRGARLEGARRTGPAWVFYENALDYKSTPLQFRKTGSVNAVKTTAESEAVRRMTVEEARRYLRRFATMAAAAYLASCATTPEMGLRANSRGDAAPQTLPPLLTEADLLGASAARLETLLGPADLTRREGAGHFLRYAYDACSLAVFLYPGETGGEVVAHIDAAAQDQGAPKPDVNTCLRAAGVRQLPLEASA